MKLGIGLHGNNGHQIFNLLKDNPQAELVAVSGVPAGTLTNLAEQFPGVHCYDTLEEMLEDKAVKLVSLCSPVRQHQAREALLCMYEGKHVYAEKPCALALEELDNLMETARRYGVHFHEMDGTTFTEPYRTMKEIVHSGQLGEIVQVLAQKSYPYYSARPQDEAIDGGLLCQVGIHAIRMIENVACCKILEIAATETRLGNPDTKGGLNMAASYIMRLEGGAIATAIANYLNQPGFGLWGNETLRIFGTKGFVEAVDGGSRTRLVIEGEDLGALTIRDQARDHFDLIVDSILGNSAVPMSMEEELHATRAILKAKESARAGGEFYTV